MSSTITAGTAAGWLQYSFSDAIFGQPDAAARIDWLRWRLFRNGRDVVTTERLSDDALRERYGDMSVRELLALRSTARRARLQA